METVFIKLFNMSITASWIVLAVLLLRLIPGKAPKAFRVLMWGMVGLRLILPFSVESILSLIPSAETIPPDIIYSEEPMIHSGFPQFNMVVNPIISESLAPTPGDSVNPMQVISGVAANLWVLGAALMMLYSVFSYFRIKLKVKEAANTCGNVWECDGIDTPFILGIIKPKIYLPSTLTSEDREYVIAHEKAHLKRRDHFWKPLGFLLLTVHWFNPVLWVAYVLLCKDIELATDEKVIEDLGEEIKKPYSEALINCSVPRKAISACPVAFGESGVKERVKAVLNYKKASFWIIVATVISCIILAVVFLTNPSSKNEASSDISDTTSEENVVINPTEIDIEELKEKYPEYFGFSPTDTLRVYIWQGGDKGYYCFCFKEEDSSENIPPIYSTLPIGQTAKNIPVMDLARILNYLVIPKEQIMLFPTVDVDLGYYQALEGEEKIKAENAFLTAYISFDFIYGYIIDSTEYDFDGDGIKEAVSMTDGPTSGLYTFIINISSGYRNTFLAMDYYPDMFVITDEGCFLKCTRRLSGDDPQSRLYKITIEDGNIVMRYGDEFYAYHGSGIPWRNENG